MSISIKRTGQRLMTQMKAVPSLSAFAVPNPNVKVTIKPKPHWYDPDLKVKHLAGLDIGR